MFSFDNVTEENAITRNLNLPYIPDHPFEVLINRDAGSRKINTLLNL